VFPLFQNLYDINENSTDEDVALSGVSILRL
jgi:hypothetical protein